MKRQTATRTPPSRTRQLWNLARGTVFLNHGSFGACPKAVLKLQANLRREMEAEPVQFLWRRYEERLEPSRVAVTKFIHARPADVVFVSNATTAVNAVLRSVRLREGEEILTTSHDYNACRNVLLEAAANSRARVVVAKVPFPVGSEDDIVEAVLKAANSRTRLAMIDHVTSSTGLVLPVARLVRELSERGVATLIDGAHAPGMLPLDVPALKADWYTGNLHKWVCAPKGAAFLWAREDRQSSLQPAVISHGNNTPRPGYSPFQDRFDWVGTVDPTPWMCAGAAIEWMGRLLPGGWPALQARNHQLVTTARDLLASKLGVPVPCPVTMLGSMATLPLPPRFQGSPRSGKIDAEQLRLHDEFHIEVPFFRYGQPETRLFRISAQAYNSIKDYEQLAQALSRV